MYFPKDMTFQYFFFDTYFGYFFQALPIALILSIIYGFCKFRKDHSTPLNQKLFSCLFVCYLTGLLCLVVGLDLMIVIWYSLIYHMDSGHAINWFNGTFSFQINFWHNLGAEALGNFLMFLPFGLLYPLANPEQTSSKVITKGIILVFLIEILQPLFGRAFDLNDIILNSLGIVISTIAFFTIKKILKK